jgi:hypothetical protein
LLGFKLFMAYLSDLGIGYNWENPNQTVRSLGDHAYDRPNGRET